MNERANPFGDLDDFTPASAKRKADPAVIDQVAEDHGFPSRQPIRQFNLAEPELVVPHQQRRRRTGRNVQINIKATQEVIDRLYRIADAHNKPLGEILEIALDALENK